MHAKELIHCLTIGLFESSKDERQIFVPYIVGEKGDGKSTIVHESCAAHNAYMIDVRLALEDVPDLKGFPFVREAKHENGEIVRLTSFATPDWIPHGIQLEKVLKSGIDRKTGPYANKPFAFVVIFFDEMARAKLDVHQVIFRMVLDFKHGDITFDKRVRFVAADNPATKDYKGVNKLDSALANRFTRLSYDGPSLAEWVEYEQDHCDPMIIRFLKEQTSMFRKGDATPRTLSKIGRAHPSFVSEDPEGYSLYEIVCGMTNAEFAAAFIRYYESSYQAIKAKTLFEGTKKEFESALRIIHDWNSSEGKMSDAIADTASDILDYFKDTAKAAMFDMKRFVEVINAFPADKTWMIVRTLVDNSSDKYPDGWKILHPKLLANADIRAIIAQLTKKIGG